MMRLKLSPEWTKVLVRGQDSFGNAPRGENARKDYPR